MKTLEIMIHKDRNVRLTALLQEVGGEFTGIARRPAVIVLPGGAYSVCSDREADPVALEFARMGYQAFILRYTVRATEKDLIWPHPVNDYDEAFELIRANADEWYVDMDRIAVCGFSAGGHLAACAATVAKNRPRAAILGYPAILEDVCAFCAPGLNLPAQEIDTKTPPCFIMAARDDTMVNVKNATAFANALNDHGVNFELHIYSYGGHGFTNGSQWVNRNSMSRGARRWMEDATRFLEEVWGQFTPAGFTEPEISCCCGHDYESYLSVNCTMLHLEKYSEQLQLVIGQEMAAINSAIQARGYEGPAAMYIKSMFTMKGLLGMVGMAAEQIDEIDHRLRKIPFDRENFGKGH